MFLMLVAPGGYRRRIPELANDYLDNNNNNNNNNDDDDDDDTL